MIRMFKVKMSEKAVQAVADTFASGMIGEGEKVIEFKQKLEERFKCQNLLPLNSGTSALTLALRLAGAKPGAEVITTPFTMIATNVAIMASGATPVFADIDPDSVNICYGDILKKITDKTVAIIVTHVGGMPCEMDKICSLNIPVISDAAHAIDTYYQDKHISNWADYCCFSFQSIKQLNTIDGGAIVIKDPQKYELAERLKWFGMTRKVPEGMTRLQHQMTADVPDWGYKFHMNDVAACIGIANLEHLDEITSIQTRNAEYYLENLKGIVGLPFIPVNSKPAWWAFYIFVKNREQVMAKLAEKGIETTPMWRRNDRYSTFNNIDTVLPNMDLLQDQILFIPVGWWVTPEDIQYIVDSIKEIV